MVCKASAVAICTRSASRFLASLSMSFSPGRFQTILKPQKTVRHFFDKFLLDGQISDLAPSPLASVHRSSPQAVMHLLVNDGVQQFAPTYQRQAANACEPRQA